MSVVDDYLATVAEPQRGQLERIRRVVLETVPDAVEEKSYGIPAFKVDGRPLLGFNVSKDHMSLYPFSPAVVDAVREDLGGYHVTKGTVRFSVDNPLSDELVRRLATLRRDEIRPPTT